MKAIDFPFRFQGGGLAVTKDYGRIVRAQIIDSAMTNFRERVMRPRYGSDAQGFVFLNKDWLRMGDTAGIIKERLINMVPRAIIDDVTLTEGLGDSTIVVTIRYRINEYANPESIVLNVEAEDE